MDRQVMEKRASEILEIFTKDEVTPDDFIAELSVMLGIGLDTLKCDKSTKLKLVDGINLHLVNIVNDME